MLAVAEKRVSCFGSLLLCYCCQGLVHLAVQLTPSLPVHIKLYCASIYCNSPGSFLFPVASILLFDLIGNTPEIHNPKPKLCVWLTHLRRLTLPRVRRHVMVIPRIWRAKAIKIESSHWSFKPWNLVKAGIIGRSSRETWSKPDSISTCGLHRSKTQPSHNRIVSLDFYYYCTSNLVKSFLRVCPLKLSA